MTKLADARRSLVRAKEVALERIDKLEEERREIKATLKSLEAALRALDGPNQKPNRPRNPTTDTNANEQAS